MTWRLPLGILCGVAITAAVIWAWQRTARERSHRRHVLYVYRHVDEILGARKAELERAEYRRYWCSFFRDWGGLGRVLVAVWWRTPSATVRWPPHRRRRLYVYLAYGTWRGGRLVPPPPGPLHLAHVHAVTLRWSTEAVANAHQFEEACERGRTGIGVGAGAAGIAQALGLQWFDGLFERARDDANHRITFTRTYAQAIPDGGAWQPQGVDSGQ